VVGSVDRHCICQIQQPIRRVPVYLKNQTKNVYPELLHRKARSKQLSDLGPKNWLCYEVVSQSRVRNCVYRAKDGEYWHIFELLVACGYHATLSRVLCLRETHPCPTGQRWRLFPQSRHAAFVQAPCVPGLS